MEETNKPISFEDSISLIYELLEKHRHKWQLKAVPYMDFDDVKQIIIFHIYKKWGQFNQSQPLSPWINRIISNQMTNLSRNVYGSMSRPCLKCAANEGGDLCNIYSIQCSKCPVYAKWEKSKKHAFDVNLPLPLANHEKEVFELVHEEINIDKGIQNFHIKMKKTLKPLEYRIYELLYIRHLSDNEVIKIVFNTNGKEKSGYSSLLKMKKIIFITAQKIKNDIDFV